jgi:hypothetical protein
MNLASGEIVVFRGDYGSAEKHLAWLCVCGGHRNRSFVWFV